MYAVIDTETTGLLPSHRHRVIEIAVVLLDARGQVEREWVTLLNPQRDLGPQHIHGILTADVLAAPEFADAAAQLGELLAGRMVVGHNVEFDLEFLRAEFERLGLVVPLITERSMCTMALAGYLYPGAKRTLGACCAAAGISIEGWHSALADTRATAALFAQYLQAFPSPPPWQWAYEEVRGMRWPALPGGSFSPTVRPVHAGGRHGWMSRLVDQLPRVPEPPQANSYLALLDGILANREITAADADQLVQVATALGLTRVEVHELHRYYVAGLAQASWAEGAITGEQRADLDRVAVMLGHQESEVDDALIRASAGAYVVPSRPGADGFPLGSTMVFTGDMIESRETWWDRAVAAGYSPQEAVRPDTTFVVAADPDSLSVKARAAREFGVPIITVEAFRRLLPERPEQHAS
ncbi:DNA polymerase III subunit epsilon [Kribbella sandramycini]|uniref:DNA polymerase III subunit epsilon n=1 Tax=Kribbella sandramycini TaxID=60450 RepID=A0A7Y4P2X6_9ACTN|nr:exonuclease domain-containing protein [Kribbella sandramycini]MBB6570399.1 DNA polymerase-3 subunit epsilon [Kribbella sandramycini]NOL45261.1 DNA polymerase III subunit epsilon [Kribbella sandramycini]